jgi:hypothetical protein
MTQSALCNVRSLECSLGCMVCAYQPANERLYWRRPPPNRILFWVRVAPLSMSVLIVSDQRTSGSVVTVIAISEEWGYGEDHF